MYKIITLYSNVILFANYSAIKRKIENLSKNYVLNISQCVFRYQNIIIKMFLDLKSDLKLVWVAL